MLKRKGLVLAISALLVGMMSAPTFAQSTASGIEGKVTDGSGKPVAGATIEVVHTPTGTKSTVVSDADGKYSLRGLRVGGPYSVHVVAKGQKDTTKNDVYTSLDSMADVNVALGSEATTLETVKVVGNAAEALVFASDNKGSGTLVSNAEIKSFPSIKRSIDDYVRFDPRIVQIDKERGGLAAGGQNNRYNNVKIDGVPTNDQFGLNDSGLPALNQPISIDWIQEFNVGISAYDVTQSDFVGANINAVTKSGGNDFHGAVYGVYRNHNMVSDEPSEFSGFDDEWTYGGYVSGPIIKDRLFFFAGYEKFKRSSPAPDVGLAGSGASTVVTGITQADVNQIRSIAATQYNFDIGSDSLPGIDNTDKKYFLKLDWNLSDSQRASFRYNKTDGDILRIPNRNSTTYSLSSNWYQDHISFENYAGILYSNWTDNFSTEAHLSYAEYRSTPTAASFAPQVRVNVGSSGVIFGTERSRQANLLKVDTWTGYLAGDYFAGDHTFRFGFDYEKNDIFNLFLQDVYGNYTFASIADFAAARYRNFTLQRSNSGNVNDAAADFKFGNVGFFAQDTWQITPQLSLLYGLRVDHNIVDNEPEFNQRALDTFGFDNRHTTDGQNTVEPRIGFNYQFETERKTQLRGGVGLFQGSAPGVWLSNMFSNPGVLTTIIPAQNGTGFSADPLNQPTATGTPPAQNVDILAPDFEEPTVWKGNLAVEHELPWYGLIFGAEYLRTVVDKGVTFTHLNLGPQRFTLPDGRPAFWTTIATTGFTSTGNVAANQSRAGRNTAFNTVILLGNTDRGSAENVTLSLEKPFLDSDWNAKIAYTYGRSKEVSAGTSSVALSNYTNTLTFDPNGQELGVSNYQIKDRYTAAYTWRHRFFGNYQSSFSMFYEGRAGRPLAYTFIGDANGDGITGNDLFFIPNEGDVAFTAASSAADQAAFFGYINSHGYLRGHQGEVAKKGADNAPKVNQFDVRFQQELPGFYGDNKSLLFLDIQNFGNLLNKKWGHIDEASFPYNIGLARFGGVNANGQYVYDVSNYVNETTGAVNLPSLTRKDVAGESRWSIQVGFRYEF